MKIKTWAAAAVIAAVLFTGPDRTGIVLAQEGPFPPAETPGEPPEKQPIVAAGKTIKINFPEMDLESILKNFSAITGKSFILDQMPKGQIVTVGPIGPVEIPRDQAMRLFTLIMDINGFVIVSTSVDNVYKVVRKNEAIKEGTLELYPPGKAPQRSENLVTRFIQLRYLDAADIVAQLTALTTKDGGQVIAYPPLNMLIIIDTAINIERMLAVIGILDVPTPEPALEIVTLKYSTPDEMSAILGQVFETGGGAAPSRSATTAPTSSRRRNPREPVPPTPVPTVTSGESGPSLKIIPVERINGLIIIADRGLINQVRDMINKLDVDAGMGGTIHVYYVQNAEASELASTLAGLSGKGGTVSTSSSTSRREENESPYRQTPGMQPGIPGLTQTPSGPTRNRSTSSAGTTSASLAIPGLLTGEISITADEPTNSLIIVATPQDWAILQDVIAKLDIPRRQVFVEAVLIELTYDESKSGGVSVHGASPLENDGVLLAGTNFGEPSSLGILGSIVSGGGSLALPSGLTMGALGRAVDVPGTGGLVQIPSAGIIVKLLASYPDVNVLSTPTLHTMDNEEASIEVGEKIPMPSGSSYSTGGFANYSITREAVGIKLNITPQINESDNIKMDIYTEISSAAPSAQGLDVNQYGVTTTNKVAETTVIVKDSQTIVIGGLMKDTDTESSSWVPFLGDIPVVGWLFKNAAKGTTKTNLVILITPHIVKSDKDFKKVNTHVKEGYTEMQNDSRGPDSDIDWYKYFDTQLPDEPQPTPDTTPSAPKPTPPQGRSLEWDWAPDNGATVETPSRSAQTGTDNPGAGNEP